MSPKSQFLAEILEQPSALRRLLSEGREPRPARRRENQGVQPRMGR